MIIPKYNPFVKHFKGDFCLGSDRVAYSFFLCFGLRYCYKILVLLHVLSQAHFGCPVLLIYTNNIIGTIKLLVSGYRESGTTLGSWYG